MKDRKPVALFFLLALLTAGFAPLPLPTHLPSEYGIYLPLVTQGVPPQPGNGPLEILTNPTGFVDDTGILHILGEVSNRSSGNMTSIVITADILNGSNQVIYTETTSPLLEVLPAGERTCFEISLLDPGNAGGFVFETPTGSPDSSTLPRLTLLSPFGAYDSITGWYDVTGQIRNDSGGAVNNVSAIATLYDASNRVIGCDFAYVDSLHLAPNQTSPFTITFIERNYTDVHNFRVQVSGTP